MKQIHSSIFENIEKYKSENSSYEFNGKIYCYNLFKDRIRDIFSSDTALPNILFDSDEGYKVCGLKERKYNYYFIIFY